MKTSSGISGKSVSLLLLKKSNNRKNRTKTNIFKKRSFLKKRGGAINEIYSSCKKDTESQDDICPLLTNLSESMKSIKNKTELEKMGDLQLQFIIPLHNFLTIIPQICTSHQGFLFVLIDRLDNYITSNYDNSLASETEIDCFKITSNFQIKYLGKRIKNMYPIYSFDNLYTKNKNYEKYKDEYSLNTLKYLNFLIQ